MEVIGSWLRRAVKPCARRRIRFVKIDEARERSGICGEIGPGAG